MFAKGYKLNPENGHMMPMDRQRCELSGSPDLETHERSHDDIFLYLHMIYLWYNSWYNHNCLANDMCTTARSGRVQP